MIYAKKTLNLAGQLLDLDKPVVMGILNLTPDSFFDGGRHTGIDAALGQAEKMMLEGARLIDVGGQSSRPGAAMVGEKEELQRTLPVVAALHAQFPQALISIDTFRASVARACVEAGACMVNDISAGRFDPALLPTVAELGVPYVLMHMQGEPADMQRAPHYEDVVLEVLDFFIQEMGRLRALGIHDIVIDPGFGFGKSLDHNFQLLKHLHVLKITEQPILAGLSRKSMICRALGVKPAEALNGTTALHLVALQEGARILRAHDVKEAMEVIKLWQMIESTN